MTLRAFGPYDAKVFHCQAAHIPRGLNRAPRFPSLRPCFKVDPASGMAAKLYELLVQRGAGS